MSGGVDARRVDNVFQYALAVASERGVQLGPIHLLKYAYLGDVAHAEATGESFTGVDWRFHKFGPYAYAAEQRVTPAMAEARAEIRFVAYERDDVARETSRFELEEEEAAALERRLAKTLPDEVATAVRRAVREYGSETARLLQHAYATTPMRRAAPGESLRLLRTVPRVAAVPVEKLAAARVELAKKFAEAIAERAAGVEVLPVDDAVHREGMEFLRTLSEVPGAEGVVEFPSDIWASAWRRGGDDDDE